MRTEPWVNERYLISYRGVGEPPVLEVRFHQPSVAVGGDHRLQVYLPGEHFSGLGVVAAASTAEPAVGGTSTA